MCACAPAYSASHDFYSLKIQRVNSCCSVAQSCLILCDPMDCSTAGFLSFTISQSLLKLTSIELVMPSRPLFSPSPAAFSLSQHQGFSSELALHIRWPKYWRFSISPSNEYSRLISFRMDWLDLLAVQGTFKHLLQHHSSKASVLQCSAFFTSKSLIYTWLLGKP